MAFFLKLAKNCCNPLVSAQEERSRMSLHNPARVRGRRGSWSSRMDSEELNRQANLQ